MHNIPKHMLWLDEKGLFMLGSQIAQNKGTEIGDSLIKQTCEYFIKLAKDQDSLTRAELVNHLKHYRSWRTNILVNN